MFWDFNLPLKYLRVVSHDCSGEREEEAPFPLFDPILIIEVRGVGVMNLDGDSMWCLGPVEVGVPK